MRKIKLFLTLLMLMCIGVTQMWGEVVSGTAYDTKTAVPTGWTEGGSEYSTSGGGFKKLTESSYFIQTDEFCQNGFTSIAISARKFGTVTGGKEVITVEWIENGSDPVVLGTITPTSTSIASYSIASPESVTGNKAGKIKISNKNASSGGGAGVQTVTITYTAGTCTAPVVEPFTVTLMDNSATLTEETAGAGVTLPSREGCEGYTFAGWTKSWTAAQSSWTATAPEIIPAGAYTPAADENLYPVYTKVEGGSGSASPTTKSMTLFSATSGNVDGDENISYAAAKGSSSTEPAVNSNEIRIYQNGGLLTISANNGKKLTEITIGSSMGTTVTYAIDGGDASSNQSISANGTFTLDDIEATSVVFTCTGTSKTTRLYLNNLSVTYSGGGSGSTTYYISEPDCSTPTPPAPACELKVTISKGTPEIGSFSLNKEEGAYETCDAAFEVIVTPAEVEHYHVSEVTASNSTSISGPDSEGKYTITYAQETDAASVINVTYVEDTKYDVTWSVNGVESTNKAYHGAHPTLPANPSSCDDESTTFMGWAAEAWSGKLAAPAVTVYTSAADMPVVEAEGVKYYAVFAKSSGAAAKLFEWAGGTKAELAAAEGVAALEADNSDYAEANAPYRVKWNGTGKYIIISVASQPGIVSAGFKMIGGATTSTVTVQEADDAEGPFTDVENLAISGSTNDEVDIESTQAFKSTTRAIKLYYTKGSNVGLGPISIEGVVSYTDYMTTCCTKYNVNIASGITNGSVSADLEKACEGATVTITFTPAGSHHLESWSVNGTAQDVTKNTFAMLGEAVTVSATFAHDACVNLAQPVLNGAIVPTYNSATIVWGEVEHASSYLVSVIKNGAEEPIFSDNVTDLSKALADLEPETQYNYSIMAVGDGVNYCAEGNPALEGNFTTAALPEVKLTLMVGGVEDDRSANHPILTAFELPSTASVDNCPKVFVGWSADANRTTAPEYAPGAEFTFADEIPATLYAVFAKEGAGSPVTYSIDFEADAATYTNWVFDNMTSNYTTSGITAHGGSKIGSTGGKATASVTTAAKIANPTSITSYVSKQSTNTTASSWKVEVSADGSEWTQVGDAQSATSMAKGEWVEVTRDLSEYSDVYVRVYYGSNTAVRLIDDLVLSAIGPKTYSEYSTACEACKVVTLAKSGEDQEKGNTFALKDGDDVVASVQTCEAASVTIEPTVATGYQVSFAISELEGASLSENTISLAADAEGELTVTANFTLKNHVVTLAQNPAVGATLVGGKEDAHYNETINLSTDVPTGYEFINWTSESVEITNATSATGASFTMPDADVTVTANFGKVYTVSFNAGSDPITETAIGAGVELPAGPALSDACVAAGWVFAGWAEATVTDETTDAPELNAAGATYHPTTDIELFAVYKRIEEGGSSIWAKMTSNPQVGDAVLLVNEDAKVEAKDKTQTKYITVEEYETTPAGLLPWTLEAGNSEGTFSFKNGDVYLNLPGASNELRQSAEKTNNSSWTISVANDGTATITNVAYTARVIKFNSGSPRFACYESGQQAIQLYKQTAASTTYYWSALECCTPHNVTIADNIEHGTVVANPTSACAGATITVTLTAENGYELTSWTVNEEAQELTATTFTMPNKAVEVSATFSEIVTPAADATLKLMENGSEVTFEGNHKVGDVVTLPNELSDAAHACEGKVLKGWSAEEITTPVADKPSENFYELGDSYTIAAEEDILYAVFAEEGAGAETIISDVLDRDLTGVTGTSYSAWSGKTATSSAVYAGQSAGSNESIQLRSNNSNSGIVTTTTGGKARKVTVNWNSNTASGRTIDIYGKSTAYTAATDLYATANQGTKLGSIVCGTSTELTIDANYEYIGIRSASGALYLTSVTIDWGTPGDVVYSNYATSCVAPLANPTFSVAGDEYNEAQTIELSAEEGTIYYTLNGATPTSASTEYTEAIVLNDCGTTTIKAIAISATNHSEIVSETYTLNIPLPTISEANPYTPAQAIDVFDGNCYNNEMVYVKGVVKTSSGLNTTYGNYDNIVVVAAETTAPEFTFYHMYKGANKEHFDANDPVIAAGDTIVAYGELTKYGQIYEFKDGCYLIDRKAYDEPKQSIINDLESAYTLAQAINFLENAATYDLNGEVYVKGVATTAPNSYNTFTAHDPEAENVFQFYNTNLNELTVGVNDTIIVKGLIKKVNANYRMEAGVVQKVTAYVAPVVPEFTVDPTAVAFGNVEQNAQVGAIELNVELTAIASATVTLGGDNASMFSIDKETLTETGVVTVSVASTATVGEYAATITLHDEAAAAEDVVVNVTMNVTEAETRKIANGSAFTAVSGDLTPADIKFAAFKGDGTTNPVINNSNIRLYKPDANNNKTTGGYLKLTALMGCTIDQVEITFKGNATASYAVNDAEFSTEAYITDATSLLTPAELNATSVSIVNLKNGSIDISAIKVYYIGSPLAVHHYILGGTFETTFEQNTEFSYEGLTVTAAYDELETITEPITDFTVVADLSEAGQTTASVRRNDVEIATYEITVTPGKANPNLAYMPAEQIVAAVEVGAWVAPELSNTLNVAPITYSTNKAAVATVDENGVIALTGGYGTAVITAHFEGDENYIASEATYTITITEPVNKIAGKWMVAGAEDIKPGIKVIVVGEKSGTKYAMGAQNTNNRAAVAAQSIVADTLYAAEGTKTFILVDAGEGLYAFQANNGMYLYAASNSSNQMKEQATLNDNGKWSIAIANDGEATIQAQGSNSRNLMSMTPNGNNNPLFSCYNSKQSAIKLYVNRNQIDGSDDPANPAEVAINDNVVEDEIVANGNVVVTVNTDNIEEPKSYIAQNGATIIITGTNPVAKNVVVEDGSRIEASVPTTTPNVYFATTMGSTQTPGTASELGSVTNITLATGGEIIYDLTLGTSMAGIQADPNQWHAFTLPFAVSATEGIYDAETGAKLYNEVNYAIMDYHGDIRANGLYGWKKYSGILQPGVFYIMTVDGNTKTFRFKATQTGPMTQTTSMGYKAYNGSGDPSKDFGWNGIGNPSWVSGTVTVNVQVLDPYSYTYQPLTSSTNITVSTPFFYNAGGDGSTGSVVMQDAGTGANYAPARTPANEIKNVAVSFGNEVFRDKIYISASEDALNEYEQDKDLVRMIMSNTPKVAQIFGNAYGMKLSIINAPMVNDKATYDLTLYAPEAGEYTIAAPAETEATIYLTKNGRVIWNLSMNEYTVDMEKGNNEGYGLLLHKAPQVVTGVENAEAATAGVQKVVIDDHVYILRDQQMFDVTGKIVK